MKNVVNFMNYPAVFNDTPFYEDFYSHLEGAKGMNKAEYNLIISKRDVKLYVNNKMIPHAGFKITNLKKYFGIKGKGQNLLNSFMEVFNQYFALVNEMNEKAKIGPVEITAF
tara:strand:+ start:179 stop:514 length:336 start_codon:yes stop_codon:yes gene_type:complete